MRPRSRPRPEMSHELAHKNIVYEPLMLQHKIDQYQQITPCMAVTTVTMHYSQEIPAEARDNSACRPIEAHSVKKSTANQR